MFTGTWPGTWNLLDRSGWPQTCRDPPASVTKVLGIQINVLLTSFKFLHICNSCSISLLVASSLPLLYFFLCTVYMLKSMYTPCALKCVPVCSHMQGSEVRPCVQHDRVFSMNFEAELLTRSQGSVIRLDWLTREVLRSAHLHLLRT